MRIVLLTLPPTRGWICWRCYLHENGFADIATYMRMDLLTLPPTWEWICGHCYLHEDGFADVATYMRMDLLTLLPTWGWICWRCHLQEDGFADVVTYKRMDLLTLLPTWGWFCGQCYLHEDGFADVYLEGLVVMVLAVLLQHHLLGDLVQQQPEARRHRRVRIWNNATMTDQLHCSLKICHIYSKKNKMNYHKQTKEETPLYKTNYWELIVRGLW